MLRYAEHPDAPPQLKADARATHEFIGHDPGTPLQRRHEERFARAFENYLYEGVAPSPQLANVFARFKTWLLTVYKQVRDLIDEARRTGAPGFKGINEDIRSVFDRILAAEPQRIPIVPEVEAAKSLADIQQEESQYIEPEHSDAAGDRAAAESDRHYVENYDAAAKLEYAEIRRSPRSRRSRARAGARTRHKA